MKVTMFATWGSLNDFLAGKPADRELSYDTQGEIAKLDRWAQKQDKANAATAGEDAAQAGAQASSDEAQLTPFASQEMHAQHLYTPGQENELLTAAGAGIGGAAGAAEGEANREAARTRNASGFAKDLDLMARDRAKTAAGISEGIAGQDVMGAKQLNQEGANLMGNLFQTDTAKQENMMNLQREDTADEVKAGQSGWLQNTMGLMKAAGDLAGGLGGIGQITKAFGH